MCPLFLSAIPFFGFARQWTQTQTPHFGFNRGSLHKDPKEESYLAKSRNKDDMVAEAVWAGKEGMEDEARKVTGEDQDCEGYFKHFVIYSVWVKKP